MRERGESVPNEFKEIKICTAKICGICLGMGKPKMGTIFKVWGSGAKELHNPIIVCGWQKTWYLGNNWGFKNGWRNRLWEAITRLERDIMGLDTKRTISMYLVG